MTSHYHHKYRWKVLNKKLFDFNTSSPFAPCKRLYGTGSHAHSDISNAQFAIREVILDEYWSEVLHARYRFALSGCISRDSLCVMLFLNIIAFSVTYTHMTESRGRMSDGGATSPQFIVMKSLTKGYVCNLHFALHFWQMMQFAKVV